jgi:hypothetical protein
MSPCWTGRWCCDVGRFASSRAGRKAATPTCSRSSAATAGMIPAWMTARSRPPCSAFGGHSRSRQDWPPTKITSSSTRSGCWPHAGRPDRDADGYDLTTGAAGSAGWPGGSDSFSKQNAESGGLLGAMTTIRIRLVSARLVGSGARSKGSAPIKKTKYERADILC